MRSTSWLPVRRRCTVRSGMSTTSSWSRPIADWPFDSSRPITSQENCLTRISLPTGFSPAEQLVAHGLADDADRLAGALLGLGEHAARRELPVAGRRSRRSSVPVTTVGPVVRLVRPPSPPVLAIGATTAAAATCAADRVDVGDLEGRRAVARRGRSRWPGITISRLLPRLEIWSETERVAPLPSVTIVMTAATPMTMPSMVRNERSRLRRIARSASSDGVATASRRSRVAAIAVDAAVDEADDAPRVGGHVRLRA